MEHLVLLRSKGNLGNIYNLITFQTASFVFYYNSLAEAYIRYTKVLIKNKIPNNPQTVKIQYFNGT